MTKALFASQIDINNLVKTLIHDISARATDPDSNPQWTTSVRDVLHTLGRNMDFEVYSRRTEKNPDCHEWLCDVVWLTKPPRIAMELAAESEWGNPGCVQDDFQKLLGMKAPVKVLLFSYKTGSNASDAVWKGIREYLIKYPYHLPGETYIFLEFHKDGCRSAVVRIEKAGQQDFNFQPEEVDTVLTHR